MELAVGDSTRLEIIFSTKSYQGLQSKRPSIETNEGPQSKFVQIKSNIYTNPDSTYPVTLKPYKWDISQYGEKERTKLTYEITNVSDQDLDLALVDTPAGMFKVNLPKRIKAGQTEKGTVEVLGEYVSKEFEKSVTVEFSDAAKTRFTIPVKRTIRIPGAAASTGTTTPSGH